jgi:DNA-binding transcriptional ArsR family regulator
MGKVMKALSDEAERMAEIHRVLANPRRLRILWALERQELSVGEIAGAIGASLQCTSQHLRLMREHGMVCSRREGQTVYYRIEGPAGQANPNWLDGPFDSRAAGARVPVSRDEDQGDL